MDSQLPQRVLSKKLQDFLTEARSLEAILVETLTNDRSPLLLAELYANAVTQINTILRPIMEREDRKQLVEPRFGGWIGTFSGKKMYPLDPQPDEICAEDIAAALAAKVRWTGHSTIPISIGEHSLRVMAVTHVLAGADDQLAPEYRALAPYYAVLHDAAEAYLADVARPVKAFLRGWDEIEDAVMQAIYKHFKLPPPPDEINEMVKLADNTLLILEAEHIFQPSRTSEHGWSFPDVVITQAMEQAALAPIALDQEDTAMGNSRDVASILVRVMHEIQAAAEVYITAAHVVRGQLDEGVTRTPAQDGRRSAWQGEIVVMSAEPPAHLKRLLEEP